MTRRLTLVIFCLALAAYVYLIVVLTLLPANIIYGKTGGKLPYGELLKQFIVHEAALSLTGASVVAYAVRLFRNRRDWRPFAVLVIGVPFALGVYVVFGL